MQYTRLIYTSTAHKNCDAEQVEEILKASEKMNFTNGITGILYFSSEYFLQYFEGDLVDVENTYQRILRDSRHTQLRVIDKASIKAREFEDWSMAYIPQAEVLVPFNKKYMQSARFNPQDISTAEALEMVMELRRQLPKAYYEPDN